MPEETSKTAHSEEEPPPFFQSWKAWYAVVLLNLVALIVLFTIFTKVFE